MMIARRHSRRSYDTGPEEQAWFAPKRFGYGAGMPISWQGWLVTLAYGVTVGLSAWLIRPLSALTFGLIVAGATAALILVCALKTQGGWRWRWGRKG